MQRVVVIEFALSGHSSVNICFNVYKHSNVFQSSLSFHLLPLEA